MKKNTILLLIACLSFFGFTLVEPPAKNAQIIFEYSYTGIEVGYDHLTRSVISVDGQEMLTTEEHKQSQPMTCSIEVPKGEHTVRLDTYAFYDGVWELHTVENGYSIDCNYVTTRTFKKRKKYKVSLLYDLDNGTEVKE